MPQINYPSETDSCHPKLYSKTKVIFSQIMVIKIIMIYLLLLALEKISDQNYVGMLLPVA
jgi:hypothetical protein